LCIGEGCWNGAGARQLHPNQKRVAGLWAARIEGISNIGYNAEEILSNIRGIEKLSAVFDTTTRYMIFPSAVWNVLAYNWQKMYGCKMTDNISPVNKCVSDNGELNCSGLHCFAKGKTCEHVDKIFKPVLVQLNDMYYVMNNTDYLVYNETSGNCDVLFSYDFQNNDVVRFGEVFFTSFMVGFNLKTQQIAVTEKTNAA